MKTRSPAWHVETYLNEGLVFGFASEATQVLTQLPVEEFAAVRKKIGDLSGAEFYDPALQIIALLARTEAIRWLDQFSKSPAASSDLFDGT